MSVYGYVRVSTMQQKTKRQIDNIKAHSLGAIIYEEKQTGTNIESREVFRALLKKLKPGDTVVFDSVSRMSRNETEGYSLYMDLMNKDISLVFLKEPHIDTAEFKRRTEKQIANIKTGNDNIDTLINTIIDAIMQYAEDNLKDDIRLAFQQAQKERDDLVQRVIEGKAKSDKHQGRPMGSLNKGSQKAMHIRKVIKEQSKDFDGRFSDAKIMREYLPTVARGTYYKYKKELKTQAYSEKR